MIIFSNGLLSQTYSVDDYGAAGDGITDDYTAIQNAIWDLRGTGGTLYFTSGKTYIISQGLTFNTFPATYTYTVTSSDTAKATIKIQNGTPLTWNHWGIRLSESRNVTISNLIIDGNRDTRNPTVETSGTDVLFIDGASDGTRLQNLNLINSPADNLYIVVHENQGQTQMTDFEMYNCILENGFRNNMSVISGENFIIEGCEFNHANGTDPQSGIDFEPNQGSANGYKNIKVEGCKFKNNVRYGIELTYIAQDCGDSEIKNNYFENNGILIGSPNNTIHHNIFAKQDHQHLHGDETRDGIIYFHANGHGENNWVYNNYFYDNPMPVGSHLVNFMYNSGGNNHLYNNYGFNNTVSGFVTNNTNPATSVQVISNNLFLSKREMAYWTMDTVDITGTTLNDLSDFDNVGTMVNSPASIAGKINEAIDFTADNNYIEIDTSNSLNIAMNITLSAWIYWEGPNVNEPEQVFLGRNNDWKFGINNSGQIGFYSANASDTSFTGGWVRANIEDSIPKYSWKYVTFTYDGQNAKLFIDAQEVKSEQANGVLGTTYSKIYIGALDSTTNSFNGSVDEVKIFNYALSLHEIEQQRGIKYYVDFTSGNDVWAGTSPATAWKTMNKVNSKTSDFVPGDSILFKRGETWKGTRLYIENIEGTSLTNIVYGAYGTGNKPVINSIINQNHTWTSIGGNIWKANNPPADNPGRMLINGVEKLRANIQSELDGVNFFWRYDEGTNDLYIFSTTDPNGSTTIEYATDFPLIIGYASNVTICNLDLQGGWTALFINTNANNIFIDSVNMGKYSRNGVVLNSGSSTPSEYPNNVVINNCNIDSFFEFDYSMAGTYSGSSDRGCSDGILAQVLANSEIKNCYLKNWGHASLNLDGGQYLKVDSILIHDNYCTSPDICYGGRIGVDDATNNEIYNNQIINTSVQTQLNGQNNHYHHNIIKGTTNSPLVTDVVDAGIELQGYGESEVMYNIFENNIIINTEGPGFRISGNNEHDVHNNTIRNNIIYQCGNIADGKSLVIETNLYQETYNNSFLNDLIYNQTTTQTCRFRDTVYDVSGFNALNGTDGYVMQNNIAANPQFTNEATDDYHLNGTSPCIDKGTTILASEDFEGTPIPLLENPDMGIYEFGVYWKGTTSKVWQTASNWSNNVTPQPSDSVTIPKPAFYLFSPKVNNNTQINKLYLKEGARLIINDNVSFIVTE